MSVIFGSPSEARACGALPNSLTLLTSADGEVLADTRVLTVYQVGLDLTELALSLTAQRGDAAPVELPVSVRHGEAEWLAEIDLGEGRIEDGTTYTLVLGSTAASPEEAFAVVTFRGIARPSVPSTLGSLAVQAEQGRLEIFAICGTEADEVVRALLTLELSDEAKPWERAAGHQLLVDDAPAFRPVFPLIDELARPRALQVNAFARCDTAPAQQLVRIPDATELELEPGAHSVQWQTTFPDGTVLTSDEQQIDLRCPVVSGDPLESPTPDSDADASTTDDSATNDSSATERSGCAVGRGRGNSGSLALALLAALAWLRARTSNTSRNRGWGYGAEARSDSR